MAVVNWSLQHFSDTAANMTANNPVLLEGQIGIETDGLTTTPKFKIGDGSTNWNTLPYFYGGASSAQNLNNVLSVGNITGGLDLEVTDNDSLKIGTTGSRYIRYSSLTVNGGLELVNGTDHIILQDTGGIHIDASSVILEQLTASRLLSLNASKEIVNETGTGFLKLNAGVISYDNSSYQPLDTDLTSWSGVTRAAGFDTFTATPSSANLSSLLTDKTGTGVNVFGTSPTFTTDISISGAGTNGFKLTSQVGTAANTALYMNAATPSATNYAIIASPTALQINAATDSIYLSVANNALFGIRGNVTSGATTPYTFLMPTSTGLTASTEVASWSVASHSLDFLSGAKTLQRTYVWGRATYTANSATTITTAIGNDFYSPVAGTNVTITTNHIARFVGANTNTYIREFTSSTSGITADGNLRLNTDGGSSSAIVLTNGGSSRLQVSNSTIYFNPAAYTSGATENFIFTVPANTGQTASTEIPNFRISGNSKTWAAGNITTQRWNYFTANTAAFASASTIKNSYGLYVEAATAGTNATITNNWALGTNGGIFLNGTANTVLGSAALATTATSGFLHVPSCAGVPTGVPTLYTGMIPIVCDSTNNKMYIYSGGAWVALN